MIVARPIRGVVHCLLTVVLVGLLLIACKQPTGDAAPQVDAAATCGDNRAEGEEQCDGADLRGMNCISQVPGAVAGQLRCLSTCEYDTTRCVVCGDGVATPLVEACDCGTDASNLPEGCLGINGAAGSACSLDCERLVVCGDGLTAGDEECDCGVNDNTRPASCTAVNGALYGECDADCVAVPPCQPLSEYCDPSGDPCCPDGDGAPTVCAEFTPIHMCIRSCVEDTDCYWSSSCHDWEGGICMYPGCAELPAEPANDFCNHPWSSPGWCVQIFERLTKQEVAHATCVEAGTLPHGAVCPNLGLLSVFRTEDMCDLGFCVAESGEPTGTCAQFCSWEAAYDVAINWEPSWTDPYPCPQGHNCFPTSHIDHVTGVRSGDLAYCLPTAATDPTDGVTTCSLITNQLLGDPGQTCANLYSNGRCELAQLDGEVGEGSLVGVCAASGPPNAVVWQECVAGTDNCPSGSRCVPEDAFANTPMGPWRCVPYCDVAHHDSWGCQTLGAPVGTSCISLSWLYGIGGDAMPSRLGYCVF